MKPSIQAKLNNILKRQTNIYECFAYNIAPNLFYSLIHNFLSRRLKNQHHSDFLNWTELIQELSCKFEIYRTILICLNYRSELSVTNVRTYGPTLIIKKASFFKSSAWAFLAHKYKLFYYVDFKMIKWGKLRHRPSNKIVKKYFKSFKLALNNGYEIGGYCERFSHILIQCFSKLAWRNVSANIWGLY